MTKHLRLLIILSVMGCFILGTALLSEQELTANNSGAPATRTGSPGDMYSCTTCHTGVAQSVTGIISSTIPATGYVPGTTYTITATVTDASKNRFGFEISPQNTSGTKLGVLSLTDAVRTKLISSGKYITHTSSGTSGTGSNTWSFHWTAPSAGTGDVTFYGAFNFSNHNNASSGDVIKLDHITAHEDLSTGVEYLSEKNQPVIFPNPAADMATFTYPKNVSRIQVFNIQGELVKTIEVSPVSDRCDIDVATFKSGTYFVYFASQEEVYSSKFIKL